MKPSVLLMLLAGWLLLQPAVGRAEEAYVTDSLEITFRSGPSLGHKVLRTLPSGEPVEVLETQDGWSRVRVAGPEPEGWVLSRYLVTRLPWKTQAMALAQENERLKARLRQLEEQSNALSAREKDLSTELKEKRGSLESLESQYESLKRESADYLKLKKEYEANRAQLEASLRRVQVLSKENEKLKSSQSTRWFFAGALVLLFGLMIGLVMGRQQRKRKPLYY